MKTFPKWIWLFLASLAPFQPLWAGASAVGAEQDYYPADLGGKWVFNITEGKNTKTASVVCDKTGTINGKPCLHLKSSDSRLSYWVQKKEDGVYIVQTCRSVLGLADLEITFDPPIPLLKFPMKKGDKWEYNGWGRTFIASKRLHITYENKGLVNSPLKQFSGPAFEVVCTHQVEKDAPVTQTSWYGKGLGFVASRSPGESISLEKFEPVSEASLSLAKEHNKDASQTASNDQTDSD